MKAFGSQNRSRWLCGILLVPMGMAVQVPVPDSLMTSEVDENREHRTTTFSFAGGGGQRFREIWLTLGYDDCTGGPISVPLDVKEEFAEIGGAVDHQVNDRFHLGLRGGYVWGTDTFVGGYDTTLTDLSTDRNFFHLAPFMSLEWKHFGMGAGVVFSGKPLSTGGREDYPVGDEVSASFSGHLRLGSLSTIYASLSSWEGVPLYSGGNFVAGIGGRPARPLELYLGWSAEGPYHGEAWMGRVTADVSPAWSLYLMGRYPEDWGGYGDEYGLSLGASYHLEHPPKP